MPTCLCFTQEGRGCTWEVTLAFWGWHEQEGRQCGSPFVPQRSVPLVGLSEWDGHLVFFHAAQSWIWHLFPAHRRAQSSASCVLQPPRCGPLQLSIWSMRPASTGEDASGCVKVAMQSRSKLFKQQTLSRRPCLGSWLPAEV